MSGETHSHTHPLAVHTTSVTTETLQAGKQKSSTMPSINVRNKHRCDVMHTHTHTRPLLSVSQVASFCVVI